MDHAPTRPEAAPIENAMSMVDEEANRGFDLLGGGPVMRVLLVCVSAEEHVLLVNTHHIATDEWSVNVMSRELGVAYAAYVEGVEPNVAELQVQYSDYARWQREWLGANEGAERNRQLAYWREQLAGAPMVLELPTDRPRPAVQSHEGSSVSLMVSADIVHGLVRLSSSHSVSLFSCLLSAYFLLLGRYTRNHDLVIGSPFAGRDRQEAHPLIGFFVNVFLTIFNMVIVKIKTCESLLTNIARENAIYFTIS